MDMTKIVIALVMLQNGSLKQREQALRYLALGRTD